MHQLRKKLGVKATGLRPPRPCPSFAHFGFDKLLMAVIQKQGFTSPTPIQAQAIPAGLSGRDVIGVAKTGSGKTAAYLLPMFVHIMDQPELAAGDGPIGLILAPTRELAQQIYTEARRFAKHYGLSVACVYGGGNRWEQVKALKSCREIVVATPGRLIDLVKDKATNFRRTSYLVLDEADRMFDLGFEPQVQSVVNHTRPDRQTLLFSATFKKSVEKLARESLTDPVRVVVGSIGVASDDVKQIVQVVDRAEDKWDWLRTRYVEFTSAGSVLIFVTRKANAEQLATNLGVHGHEGGWPWNPIPRAILMPPTPTHPAMCPLAGAVIS